MRGQFDVDYSSSEGVGDDVEVLERTDEKPSSVVLKIDGDCDGGVRLNGDEAFSVGDVKSHYLFDFYIQMQGAVLTFSQGKSCMSQFLGAFNNISTLSN